MVMMWRICFILLLFFAGGKQGNYSKLYKEIETLNADKSMLNASWSLCVINCNNDSVVGEYNTQRALSPASTLKTITTAAAFGILGSNYTIETKLMYDGTFDSKTGIIKGNLYLVGGGDPTLESDYFKDDKIKQTTLERWAAELKQKGIKSIEGAIIADETIFEYNTIPSEWIWGDVGNYYGAGACGLSYKDNTFSIFFNTSEKGSKSSIVEILPTLKDLQLVNNVIAAGKTDSAYVFGAPYSNYRTVLGVIPPNKTKFEVKGALPDPALFCAQQFNLTLKAFGVNISEKPTSIRILSEAGKYETKERKLLYTHRSPALDKIIYWTNQKSINLFAEHLLKLIAVKIYGKGVTELGVKAVKDYWKSKGIDVNGLFNVDGSGLARANTITTKTQAEILAYMFKDKNYKAYLESFCLSGKQGSMENMCKGSFAENNMRAKSGYINRVRAYTGFTKNQLGETLCFSLIANNYDCTASEMKKKLEKILIAIAESE
jgi:D-alanyl-D-alanine carboxypeptidase/D-alanyl-D-alanine-endopeptidase (penicillin-binding protein 4)